MVVTKNWIGVLNGEKFISSVYESIHGIKHKLAFMEMDLGDLTISGCQRISSRLGSHNYCIIGKNKSGQIFLALIAVCGKRKIEQEVSLMAADANQFEDCLLLIASTTGVNTGKGSSFCQKKFRLHLREMTEMDYKDAVASLAKCIKNL